MGPIGRTETPIRNVDVKENYTYTHRDNDVIYSHVHICHTSDTRNSVISGFRREVDENCALLSHYTASSGNLIPTFLDNLSVSFSGVKNRKKP